MNFFKRKPAVVEEVKTRQVIRAEARRLEKMINAPAPFKRPKGQLPFNRAMRRKITAKSVGGFGAHIIQTVQLNAFERLLHATKGWRQYRRA